jgi:imidazolonepropionase-like amidohydrolase
MKPDELRLGATERAASLLGLEDGYGSLAEGARTDLVWFGQDPFVALAAPESQVPAGPRDPVAGQRPLGMLLRGFRSRPV